MASVTNTAALLPAGTTMLYLAISGVALYGAFFVLVLVSLWMLVVRQHQYRGNWWLAVALLAIFIFTTVNVCLSLHIVTSIILSSPEIPSLIPLAVFFEGGGQTWAYVLQTAMCELNVLTADAVLIYRTWRVWEKRWIVVSFNIVVSLASFAIWIRITQLFVLCIQDPTNLALYNQETNLVLAFLVLSLVGTVTATLLISYRLWRADREAPLYTSHTLRPVIRILVESGGIYALAVLVYVIINSIPSLSAVNTGFTEIFSPILGISFALIIVRVGMTATSRNEQSVPTKPTIISVHRSIRTHQDESGRVLTLASRDGIDDDIEMGKLEEVTRSRSLED